MAKILKTGIIIFFISVLFIAAFREISQGEGYKLDEPIFVFQKKNSIKEQAELKLKIGQMLLVGFDAKFINKDTEKLFKEVKPGGVLLLGRNVQNSEQLKTLISGLQEISLQESGLPLFVAVDQEGGLVFRISWLDEKTPQPAIKSFEEAQKTGFKRGKELQELGINLNLSPILDLTMPGDFLFARSFQKDKVLTGEFGKAMILGQKEAGIFTAIKHFPGYGFVPFDPEIIKLAVVPQAPEISQFQKAAEAEPEMVMIANMIYQDIEENVPLAFSKKGIRFLKENLKGGYLIISDDLSSKVLKESFSLEKSLSLAAEAGVDILLVSDRFNQKDALLGYNALLEAVEKGELSKERIEESFSKILRLKERMQNFPRQGDF